MEQGVKDMANAKEQFGLDLKQPIHGVVEHETTPQPADEYSAQLEAKLKTKEVRAKAVNKKVPAYKITVSGNVRNNNSAEAYCVTVTIPHCADAAMQYHIQNFVVAELVKAGKLRDGVINRAIDEIEETEIELSFIGKDIFSLTKDEVLLACDYYDIVGCGYENPSLRAIQKEFYVKYLLKTDESLQDSMAAKLFISKMDSIIDYKKLPVIKLSE